MGRQYETFGRCVDRCQSFIERRFAVALLFTEKFSFEPYSEGLGVVAIDAHGIILGQQVPVGGYHADFALKRRGSVVRVAIELDGHRYHDASPEAAQRDRIRDRVLTSLGWRTIRFTGKEIIQDAMGCAMQAHRIIVDLTRDTATAAVATPLAKTSAPLPLQLPLRTTG